MNDYGLSSLQRIKLNVTPSINEEGVHTHVVELLEGIIKEATIETRTCKSSNYILMRLHTLFERH